MYDLLAQWYQPRPADTAAAKWLVAGAVKGTRTLLVEGVPGAGKTALGEALAEGQGWTLVFYQCHSWSSDQEMFRSIDVAAAVRGDADHVEQDGCLVTAVKRSLTGPVLLILDEVDKASDRVDGALLDFLQSGRIPLPGGATLQGNVDHLRVVITTNGCRELNPALVRRCRRLVMNQLPADMLDRLTAEQAEVGHALARQIRRICQACAAIDGQESSLQEMVNLGRELKMATSDEEVSLAIEAWAPRGARGREYMVSKDGTATISEICRLVTAV